MQHIHKGSSERLQALHATKDLSSTTPYQEQARNAREMLPALPT